MFDTEFTLTMEPAANRTLDPPLKWAGGKRWQLPHLRHLWQPHAHRRLVEPFCGGLAVSLGLRPDRALLNDVNAHVVNFYRWVQRGLTITIPMRNERAFYDAHRNRFNALVRTAPTSDEAASLFYYLNRTGFNGLCRFNQSGGFNAPFGKYATVTYRRSFEDEREALTPWTFMTGDFADMPLDPEDFVYCDPPYDAGFVDYAEDGFGWEDQVRLVTWLGQHPGPVVLTNRATSRIVALYERAGFQLRYLDAPRRISCTGDRTPVREVLAMRNLAG